MAAGDKITEGMRILAALAAVAQDPTPLSALKTGPGLLDSLKKIAASPPASFARLAEDLGRFGATVFAALPEKPRDAEVLYLQMVEAGLPDPARIMADRMDAAAVTEGMLAGLVQREHRDPAMQALFRALTQPALERLLADKAFAADLTPAFMRAMVAGVAGLSEKLDDLGSQRRDILLLLAGPFEIERAYALSDAELRQQLELRAEDYRRYRAQIEAIDERTAGLGNLKAAAREAVGRLDFEEVEALLARVDEVETEIAAETKILRADNALLRGRSAEAFAILSAAADSFASVDSLEPMRRRLHYEDRFYTHGLRYGGDGLALSARMICAALDDPSMERGSELEAQAQNCLGIALWAQGERLGGPEGTAFLGEAVTTHRNALRVRTRDKHPMDWAKTQNNLGIALHTQGERLGGPGGNALLAEAVAAYRNALCVRTKDKHLADWAITQNNLGVALQTQGERIGGPEGAALLGEAVAAYRDILCEWSEAMHSINRPAIQNNLGIALKAQGALLGGPNGAALLSEAVAAYRDALRRWTEAEHPVNWAMAQNNLGLALEAQGAGLGGQEGLALLNEAVAAYRDALRVRIEAAHPVDWAVTTENLGVAHESLADNPNCADPRAALEAAVDCFTQALRVFDPESMPHNHDKAAAALARVRGKLAALPDPA